jgi:hypothetical protein
MSYHYPRHVGTTGAAQSDRQRISDLVHRYPRITDDEAKEILTFMRKGRHLDIGLLTADESIRPNLDAFMDDHKAHFRLKWSESAAVVGGIAALLVILWLIWEALS